MKDKNLKTIGIYKVRYIKSNDPKDYICTIVYAFNERDAYQKAVDYNFAEVIGYDTVEVNHYKDIEY